MVDGIDLEDIYAVDMHKAAESYVGRYTYLITSSDVGGLPSGGSGNCDKKGITKMLPAISWSSLFFLFASFFCCRGSTFFTATAVGGPCKYHHCTPISQSSINWFTDQKVKGCNTTELNYLSMEWRVCLSAQNPMRRGTHRLKSWAAARDGQVMFDIKWMNPSSARDRTLAVAIRPNKFNALRRGVRTSFPPLPSFCTTETRFEHQGKASEHETQRKWSYLLDSSECQWTNNNSSRNPMTPKTS